MLRIFVDESRKETLPAARCAAWKMTDKPFGISFTRNLPLLGKTVNLDYPMETLHEIVTTESGQMAGKATQRNIQD